MGDAKIPDDWQGEYCCYSVKWPKSPQWEAVLRGIISIPRTGRFWDESTGTITDTQAVVEQTLNYNYAMKEALVSCGSDELSLIADAIQALAAAQTANGALSSNCCNSEHPGAYGAGTMPTPISTTSPGDPATDPPPDGFDTWAEWRANKCARCDDFVVELERSVLNLQNAIFIGTEASGLALVFTILISVPIPFVACYSLALLLLGVAAEEVLDGAHTVLTFNRTDLVCALYNGRTAAESRSNFISLFNSRVDDGGYSTINAYAIKQVMDIMVGSEGLNQLTEKSLVRNYDEADCSGCNPSCVVFGNVSNPGFEWGSGDLTADGSLREIQSGVAENGRSYIGIVWNDIEGCTCGLSVTVESMVGYMSEAEYGSAGDQASSWVDCADTDTPLYHDGGPELNHAYCTKWLTLSGQSEPFSAMVRISLEECA